MSEIKIFVTYTPNKNQIQIESPLFYPVLAGSDFQKGAFPAGMLKDNTGEHISFKNKSYCELTTQYWAWKNVEADYYGFCHYRRYFSFSSKQYREADCGCLVYPYLNEEVLQQLQLQEDAVRKKAEQYDFLIAKGIPAVAFQAKNVYEAYRKAPDLHGEDLDLMLTIIREKYPHLTEAAKSYLHGKIFYPCNMFLMKKELFHTYSEMLFTILEEFEKRCDRSNYSREGRRTPGHLGERFAGIFYNYLKKQGKYRLGELQIALIAHTEAEDTEVLPYDALKSVRLTADGEKTGTGKKEITNIVNQKTETGKEGTAKIVNQKTVKPEPAAGDGSKDPVTVVLAANQAFVPVLFTCLRSLVDHADTTRHYYLWILHTNITRKNRAVFRKELSASKIHIGFVNVSQKMAKYPMKERGYLSSETYYRFFIPEIFQGYPKVVYLDADTILREDIAKLYDTDLADDYLAAALDADMIGQYHGANTDTKQYCDTVLRLANPYHYFQAGVLVLNIELLRQNVDAERLFAMAATGKYRHLDQDILNVVCMGHVKKLDMAWNTVTDNMHYRYRYVIKHAPCAVLDAYEKARKNPYIIHYSGGQKPWKDPKGDLAREFWKAARRTPYYEELLYGLRQADAGNKKVKGRFIDTMRQAAKKVLPQGSWIRRVIGGWYWKLKRPSV